MEFDLKRRTNKFEKEQERLREEARRRKAKEEAAKKIAQQRQSEIEELSRARKAAEEAAAIEAEARREAEWRMTAGVDFQKQFTPLLLESEDDKVILPPSVLADLEAQNALAHGPVFFRVHIPGQDKFTHCGVREFSADDGIVMVPPRVLNSLTDDPASCHALVLKYVRLPRCKYAKIRPATNDFSQIGPVRDVLEQNLHYHATTTVGDKIVVWHRDRPYQMVVTELQPEDSCTLINTEVEVDIDVSEEYQRFLDETGGRPVKKGHIDTHVPGSEEEEQESEKPADVFATTVGKGQPRTLAGSSSTSASATAAVPMDIQQPAVKSLDELPPEPAGADPAMVIRCKVRMTNGENVSRAFLRSDSLQALFNFVDAVRHRSASVVTGDYRLVTRFPSRSFTRGEHGSQAFVDVGLDQPQEMFFVEV